VPQTLLGMGENDELIFVDYDCQQNTWAEIARIQDPRIQIVRTHNCRWFHTNHARNLAGRRARNDLLLFTDIDHYTPASVVEETRRTNPKQYGIMPNELCNWGWLAIHKADFWRINGYEEALCGYGEDDFQMRKSLMAMGRSPVTIKNKIVCVQEQIEVNGRSYLRQEQVRCHEDRRKNITNAANIAVGRALRLLHPYKNNIGRNWGNHGHLEKRKQQPNAIPTH